jgi:3-oxoacyl-(acyl-carrier-protein) synthase
MLNNACTSGSDAVGVGSGWLEEDLCDLVICGGNEVILERIQQGFRSLMLCSPVPCQPFDKNRQGLTLGEGAGVLLLEKRETPRQALARFLGYGAGSDAFHPTSPHPEARGLALAVRSALSAANLCLNDISFVNAHGTGTPHNDLTEGKWIARNLPHAPVVASKGYTGHALGAAGAIEAVLTALSLIRGCLPASRGFAEPDPAIEISPTTTVASGDYAYGLSLSLGFGGTIIALILGRAP